MNTDDNNWSGHLFLCGATECGKSTFLAKYINTNRNNRKCYLFTRHTEDDQSLEPIKDITKKIKVDGRYPRNLEKVIYIFDDYVKVKKKCREKLLDFANDCCQNMRHNNISCIFTNHVLRGHKETKDISNDCKYVCLFPAGNKYAAMQFLEYRMGLPKYKRDEIVNESMKHGGRFLFICVNSPCYWISEKSIRLL